MKKKLLESGGVVLNRDIIDINFTCDLKKCKGACCTMESELGAPLTDSEIKDIERNYENVKEYLPEKHRKAIADKGFWEEKQGQLMTRSIGDRDCVFVTWDSGVAKCGIEKAYFDGKSDFRKPVSCHLFPIRVTDFGGPVLHFESYSECEPALVKGENETKLSVLDFCEDALVRAFGEEWFKSIKEKSRSL